ncbi:MAG TPA: CPBP family intramembrane glutamic endopeptidase [Candidatus Angelobacter sp.]|nr:CPBP family intramembrane glutamic endopeptidase [Candidatus Angelobacter sp.]
MDQETAGSRSARPLNFIFRNERGLRAGWRALIFLLIVYGIPALLVITAMKLAGPQPKFNPPSILKPAPQLLQGVLVFLWILFGTWIMSRIERRPMGTYGLPLVRAGVARFFTGYFFWGFLPLTLELLLMRALGLFYFGPIVLHGPQIISWALIWAAVFLLVGLVEEFSIRGYILYTLSDGIGFWPSAIILAVGFARAHMGNPGETRVGIIATGFFALFAAATLRRTGNLWLAVGAHAGWDWGQSFFYGVSDSGLQAQGHLLEPHSQGPAWLTGGTVGPEGSVFTLILWALMMIGFLMFYRKKQQPALVIDPAQ